MGVPQSSILVGFPIINHPFWGNPHGNPQMLLRRFNKRCIETPVPPRVVGVSLLEELIPRRTKRPRLVPSKMQLSPPPTWL